VRRIVALELLEEGRLDLGSRRDIGERDLPPLAFTPEPCSEAVGHE
jgi:hypothetical protein